MLSPTLCYQRVYLSLNLQISYQEYSWFLSILGNYSLLSYIGWIILAVAFFTAPSEIDVLDNLERGSF